jgi:hypothetical protein
VVTPRVEANPDRSDAKLGDTIPASLVQAAKEHANHARVRLEQTKQFADDIRSQVAGRELAEMNEWLMAFGDSPPVPRARPGDRRHDQLGNFQTALLGIITPASTHGLHVTEFWRFQLGDYAAIDGLYPCRRVDATRRSHRSLVLRQEI